MRDFLATIIGKIVVTKPTLTYFQPLRSYSPPTPPTLNNVLSLQNVSDLFSIASHNISVHVKPTLNREGGGEGRGIKNSETSYFCGHVTTNFVNDCRCCARIIFQRDWQAPLKVNIQYVYS